jgi:hypothetical protein
MTELEKIQVKNRRRDMQAEMIAFDDAMFSLEKAEEDLAAIEAGTFKFEPTYYCPEFSETETKKSILRQIKFIRAAYPSIFN